MNLSTKIKRKPSHKLNEFIHIPTQTHQPNFKHPNLTFHHEQSRLDTDVTELPPQPKPCSSSLYDTFHFVDRLTNNKLSYRDVRKASNSLLHLRTVPSNQFDEKPPTNSLLQIFRKTKKFQMKSLKEKIFKKIQTHKQIDQTSRQIQDSQSYEFKTQKACSLIHLRPETSEQFIERSRKNNKLRSFIDQTVMNMNKAELHRIVNQKDTLKEEVLHFNEDVLKIKCTLDRDRIEELMHLRKKQEWSVGRPNHFVEKEKPILFKDLTNFGAQKVEEGGQVKAIAERQVSKNFGKGKRKRMSGREQKDNFFEKMMVHARRMIKEGEFLVDAKKENLCNNMLMKRSRKELMGSRVKEGLELKGFEFSRHQESELIAEVKSLVKLKTSNQGSGDGRCQKSQLSVQQGQIINLLKQNYISNLGVELTMNPCLCQTRDQKGNNLLHMAVRYENPDMMEMLLRKLPYRVCRGLLMGRNAHKRTPLELAKLVMDLKAVAMIEKFIKDNKQKDIVEGWIDDDN